MDTRWLVWLWALAVVVSAAESEIPVHVVYVQYYDQTVRAMNNGNSLHVIAPTMHAELESLVRVYTTAHEVIAMLTATCTRHTKMTTEVEGTELETFLFVYTDTDAVMMQHYVLAQPPKDVAVEEPPARLNPREKKTPRRAALPDEL